MIEALVILLVIYALALALVAFVSAARGRGPARWQLAFAIALEAGLIVQAGLALAATLRGDGPDQGVLALGYLIASVIILPAVAEYARRGGTRWDSLTLGVAALVIAVIVLRLGVTWSSGA